MRGTADAEIEVPSVGNPGLSKVFLFETRNRSEYRFTCSAYRGDAFRIFVYFGSFDFIFSCPLQTFCWETRAIKDFLF